MKKPRRQPPRRDTGGTRTHTGRATTARRRGPMKWFRNLRVGVRLGITRGCSPRCSYCSWPWRTGARPS